MSILQQDTDVRIQIKDYLKSHGIRKNFLAQKISVSNGHLSGILKCERVLTAELLIKINDVLKTDFSHPVKPNISMRATG